jgi:hypothetical protein
MRTAFSIITLLLISFNYLSAQLPEERLKKMVLDHEIKSLTQLNHKFKDDKPEKEGYKNSYKEFDENGNVIKEIYYRRGDINQKLSYKYDHNQNKTEYVNYSARNDEVSFRQTINYDNENKKVLEKRFNGSEHFNIKYQYNKQDQLTEIVKKKQIKSGASVSYELDERRVFSRDGNVTTIRVLDPGEQLITKIVNKYDDDGNLIEFNEYQPTGELIKKISYEFNDENQKIVEIKHQKGNFIYKKNFHYNKDGNLVEIQQEQPEGNVYISKIFHYNDKNQLVKEMWYDTMAEKYSHKIFTYDKKGILEEVEVFYALYNYKVLYRFDYEYF